VAGGFAHAEIAGRIGAAAEAGEEAPHDDAGGYKETQQSLPPPPPPRVWGR